MRVLYFELKQNIPLYHHQLFVELIEKLGTLWAITTLSEDLLSAWVITFLSKFTQNC